MASPGSLSSLPRKPRSLPVETGNLTAGRPRFGAAYLNRVIEGFSSRGPTIDGRTKPDLHRTRRSRQRPTEFVLQHVGFRPLMWRGPPPPSRCRPVPERRAIHALLVDLTEDRGLRERTTTCGAGLLRLGVPPSTVAANSGCVLRYAGSDRYATAAIVSQEDFTAGAKYCSSARGKTSPTPLRVQRSAGKLGHQSCWCGPTANPGATAAGFTHDSTRTPSLSSGACQQSLPWSRHGTRRVRNSHPALRCERYATAAAISQYGFPGGATVAVVVTGESFPDPLRRSRSGGAQGSGATHHRYVTSLPDRNGTHPPRPHRDPGGVGGPNACRERWCASLTRSPPPPASPVAPLCHRRGHVDKGIHPECPDCTWQ